MQRPAIQVRGLGKRFGDVDALREVEFTVAPGEVFAYLGRNGSGKTTTVRILATLSIPTTGTAMVAGRDVVREPEAVREAIGVTMQSAALDPSMTGREHLELCAGLLGLDRRTRRARAAELLERFGLADAARRPIRGWSGGMQRRLDLATALLREPRILFLDEPTTGLDVQSRQALWDEIRRMRDRGVTVFLTTQYLEEADRLADRVAILDRGRVVALAAPAGLKGQHGATVLEVSLADPADAATVDGVLATQGLAAEVDHTDPGTVRIRLASGGAGTEGLDTALRLRSAGVALQAVRVHEPTLDDVFVALTGTELVDEAAEVPA